MYKHFIFIFFAFALCTKAMAKEPKGTLTLRVMTYNLRYGELASLEQLAAHIKAFQPDFVALEEVDCFTKREDTPHQHNKISSRRWPMKLECSDFMAKPLLIEAAGTASDY